MTRRNSILATILLLASVSSTSFAQDPDGVKKAQDQLDLATVERLERRAALLIAELRRCGNLSADAVDRLTAAAAATIRDYVAEHPAKNSPRRRRLPRIDTVLHADPWASVADAVIPAEVQSRLDAIEDGREERLQGAARGYILALLEAELSLAPVQLEGIQECLETHRFYAGRSSKKTVYESAKDGITSFIQATKEIGSQLSDPQRKSLERFTQRPRLPRDDFDLAAERLRIHSGLGDAQYRILIACGRRRSEPVIASGKRVPGAAVKRRYRSRLPVIDVEADSFWTKLRDSISRPEQRTLQAELKPGAVKRLVQARARLAIAQLEIKIRLRKEQRERLLPLMERVARGEIDPTGPGAISFGSFPSFDSFNALKALGLGFRTYAQPFRREAGNQADIVALREAVDEVQGAEL